jgi:hypothetical protein
MNYWTLTLGTTNNYDSLTWVTPTKDYCNCSTHKLFCVFTSRWLIAASNGGRSPSSGFPNSPRSQLPVSQFSQLQLSTDSTDLTTSKSKLCYDQRPVGQSDLVSSPIWGPRPECYYYKTVACSFDRETVKWALALGCGNNNRGETVVSNWVWLSKIVQSQIHLFSAEFPYSSVALTVERSEGENIQCVVVSPAWREELLILLPNPVLANNSHVNGGGWT